MADKAIGWIRTLKAVNPDKPFLAYYTRAPHTLRTMPRRNGSTSSKASSTTAGTASAR